MTNEQKTKIIELRKKGFGYGQIAVELSLSKNTVSSFCKRNELSYLELGSKHFCKYCGKEIINLPKKKAKTFCSDVCRMKWWKINQNKVNKKAFYKLVCKCCKKEFISYGNKDRKYCSVECYRTSRAIGGGHNE